MTTMEGRMEQQSIDQKFNQFSLTLDQVLDIKRAVCLDAPYFDRLSLGLALRLGCLMRQGGEDQNVLLEIDHLERNVATTTKKAQEFRHLPLFPFWHKHFHDVGHLMRNIGDRWGVSRGEGSDGLDSMIRGAIQEIGHDLNLLSSRVARNFFIGGIEDRSKTNRLTGDWIIFAKYEGRNYYLDVATHEEGNEPERLMRKLHASSAMEFPFLFQSQ